MRVVYDGNTLLQALSSPGGPAGHCVQLAIDGKVSLFTSPFVMQELREVASRPKVIAKLKLGTNQLEEFVKTLEMVATLLQGFPEIFSYQRDPDDAHYVNLALAANAQLIVSRDRDLLDLMDLTKPEAAEFQNCFPNLRICDPVQFIRDFFQVEN